MSKIKYCIVEHNPSEEDEADQFTSWAGLFDTEQAARDLVQDCFSDAADFPLGHTIFITKVVAEITRPNIKLKYAKVG